MNRIGTLLLTGATGMIGNLLVDELVARGVPFRALVRSKDKSAALASKPGATVVVGDLDAPSSLEGALAGVDRAFLLTNSSERAEAQQTGFVTAARAAGVKHLVNLSQFAARADSPVRFLRYHAVVEQAMERSGLTWTSLRPNLILQAYLAFGAQIKQGVLRAPIASGARVSVVDARDIAAVAAAALTAPGHEGKTYTLTGPAALTHGEIADAFGRASGHDVRFETIAAADFAAAIRSYGMPEWQAAGLVEDYAHYDRGEAAHVSPDIEQVTGKKARSIDDFARDNATSFSGTR